METSHRDSDTMTLTDLAKEVLLYMALLTDYISYYWNAFLCMLFHHILGGPNPLPVHEASPTSHPAVLVAEASVGVGRDTAITLARHGYTVFATVRDQEESEDLTREFSQFDNENQGCLVPIAMDATNKSDIQNAYNIVWNMLGGKTPFVGLVNSTEQVIHTPMEVASDVAFHESFEANFFRVINLTKAFLPLLRESHGRVVNIGSISAWHTAATMGVHASAKAALRALTRTWGQELRSLGVGMSLVETGIVDTQLTQQVNRNFLSFTTFPADSRYYEIQHNAEPTVIQTYEHQYRVIGRHCNEILGNAAPPALVTDAIMNALTAPYPKATYYVGVDARFLATLNWLLGERTVDAIQAKFLGF